MLPAVAATLDLALARPARLCRCAAEGFGCAGCYEQLFRLLRGLDRAWRCCAGWAGRRRDSIGGHVDRRPDELERVSIRCITSNRECDPCAHHKACHQYQSSGFESWGAMWAERARGKQTSTLHVYLFSAFGAESSDRHPRLLRMERSARAICDRGAV